MPQGFEIGRRKQINHLQGGNELKVNLKRIVQFAISLILLIILIYWIDLDQLKVSLINADYYYLGLAFLVVSLNRVIMATKWNMLLRVKGIVVSWGEAVKIYYIANFLGLFLPPTVGTDLVRAYYVSKKKFSLSDVLASILVERILGFIALFIFGLFGAILFIGMIHDVNFDTQKLFTIILLITIVGIGSFVLSFNLRIHQLVSHFLESLHNRKVFGKFTPKLQKLIGSYESYKNQKGVLLAFFLLTFLEIFTVVVWSYLVAIGINADVPFVYFLAFIPIILTLIRLPISLDGFGINEGGYVYFLALISIPKTLGFSIGFINHLVTIIGVLPGGLFYALNRSEIRKTSSDFIRKNIT